MQWREAIIISSLPYRRTFYQRGGWLGAPFDQTDRLFAFIERNFGKDRLRDAVERADRYPIPISPISALAINEPRYPRLLREIFDPPPVLFEYGRTDYNLASTVAIVGTRNPAPIAVDATIALVASIKAQSGGLVVSGLARGIDRVAHRHAIYQSLPGVAVLGTGFGQQLTAWAAEMVSLAARNHTPFALLSEFPPDFPGSKYSFPRRNRIIAGMVKSICIMQAPAKSGALITARYGLDEGREVLAFDHPLMKNRGFNEGCRALLIDGAKNLVVPGGPLLL